MAFAAAIWDSSGLSRARTTRVDDLPFKVASRSDLRFARQCDPGWSGKSVAIAAEGCVRFGTEVRLKAFRNQPSISD